MSVPARRLGVAAALVDGVIVPGDVTVAGALVERVGVLPAGARGLAAPGLVDLQLNGWAGVDLLAAAPDDVQRAATAIAATGTTAFAPTLITSAPDDTARALAALDEARSRWAAPAARILPAHLEGPFLAATRIGAHPPALRRDPDAALARRLCAAGAVGIVTLAPELPGALSVIRELAAGGVVVLLGHTDATAAEATAGLAAGARGATHLWNAMRPLTHRDPGVVGAVLADGRARPTLIADGVHVADEVLALTLAAAGGRVALVSDAIAAGGAGDGTFRVGDVVVHVVDGVARRDGGTLAGATAPLLAGVATLVRLGVPLPEAIGAATRSPALLLGSGGGRLAPGERADVLVLDDELQPVLVLVDGLPTGGAGTLLACRMEPPPRFTR